MACWQLKGKSTGKRWQNQWQTIVFFSELPRNILERIRKNVHVEAQSWDTSCRESYQVCVEILLTLVSELLGNCHTTLLEDAFGPSISANESTGASANGCTDASANEANGQNCWEGSLGRGSREHIQHIQHVQHIQHTQHVQHLQHTQHVQRQTREYGTASGLILKRQTV